MPAENSGKDVNDGFAQLRVWDFQQFADVDLDLSSRLTVITGANGAGKTTLLNILGNHFSWHLNFLSNSRGGNRRSARSLRDILHEAKRASRPDLYLPLLEFVEEEEREAAKIIASHPGYRPHGQVDIGAITYRSGKAAALRRYESEAVEFSVGIEGQQSVDGLFINSHRITSAYKRVESIPAQFGETKTLLDDYLNDLRAIFGANNNYYSSSDKGSMVRMKETLLAAALYGEGNLSVRPDGTARAVWEGFHGVLRTILPESLRFRRLVSEPPEITVVTDNGDFPIDGLSGGLRALFELAWQIHLKSFDSDSYTVCFDEPENHLHPSLQRSLVPNLLKAFPLVNFVIATHSPFVVTAAPSAMVYVLDYDQSGRVKSEMLDFRDRAMSAEQTLTDVLGLETTSPQWVEDKYDSIVGRYLLQGINKDSLPALAIELNENGLGRLIPDALARIFPNLDEGGDA